MDSIYRDIQLRNAKCKPSVKEGNKYLDCSGSWKEMKEMIARKLGFQYWIRIFPLDVSKKLTGNCFIIFVVLIFFLERDCFGSCILKMQINFRESPDSLLLLINLTAKHILSSKLPSTF